MWLINSSIDVTFFFTFLFVSVLYLCLYFNSCTTKKSSEHGHLVGNIRPSRRAIGKLDILLAANWKGPDHFLVAEPNRFKGTDNVP
jgi:hypothetical protein